MTFYIPGHFRIDDRAALEEFVARHGFATLVSHGPAGLSASHVPLHAERDAEGGLRLLGHLARANPHWRELEQADEVLAVFAGPHAYVSPTWYEHHPAVPTWNYAVVHARGKVRLLPEEALPALLDQLSRAYEDGRPAPWRLEAQPGEFIGKMLGAIVGFELSVRSLEGKFKLSQNRRPGDIERVASALEEGGEKALADLMRAHARRPPESR